MKPTDLARALFVATGAIAQVVMGSVPFARGWEHTVASRSAEVEVLLTPAGYAFSIWSVLFLGAAIYAVVHFIRLSDPVMRATGWLAGLAFWFNTAWESWVPFYGIEIVSMGLIGVGWLSAVAFMVSSDGQREAGILHKALRLPIFALGGWLNAAAFVNLLIVAEVYGVPWLGSGDAPAAIAVLAAATLSAVIIVWRTASLSYAAALAWGLWAIVAANGARGEPEIVATAAQICMGAVLIALLAGIGARLSTTFRPR